MIEDIILRKGPVVSFEVFPPRSSTPLSTIYSTLEELKDLNPGYISVTYSAGGSAASSHLTVQIASDIKNKYGIDSVAHLPGSTLTKTAVKEILTQLKENGINNILALRGDIPPEGAGGDFRYASDLIEFIRREGDFNIIGACYPEGHFESGGLVQDIQNLKTKVDSGASLLVSQLFFDNDYFFRFLERASIAGIKVPIQAGIMPISNKKQIERIVSLCKVELPKKFIRVLERYENDPIALRDAGIAYAKDQIVDLIASGVDGIHLYTMNNPYVAKNIMTGIESLLKTGESESRLLKAE